MDLDARFLHAEHKQIRRTGYALAGGLTDLAQRASVYYHLYEDSGRRNVFPLIAAHGALWASGYFSKGTLAGSVLSLQYLYSPAKMRAHHIALQNFANAFRDINRRVCAEAFSLYHFTKKYGTTAYAKETIPQAILNSLNQCHQSQKENTAFTKENRRQLFETFFLWEQETIVASAVESAVNAFDWPAVKWLAMRPKIEFAYFGAKNGLQFKNFYSQTERITRGMQAYELAEAAGYEKVEAMLKHYSIMPGTFFDNTSHHFSQLRNSLI